MAEIFDATACQRVGLDEALTAGGDFCRVLQSSGGESVPTRPLLWPADIREFSPLHDAETAAALTADVDVHFVRNVSVGGFGGSVLKDGRYVYNAAAYPYYAKYFIEKDISKPFWVVDPKPELEIKEPIYVISHFNPIYGHWLLEIFPKIFGIAALAKQGLTAPILLPNAMPPFVKETIATLLPGQVVVEYDHNATTVKADLVILPGMMHADYVFNSSFAAALDPFLEPLRRHPGPKNIYVSRSGLSGKFREAENAEALDEAAVGIGLTVMRPEELPWLEQVRIFASAHLVVGEYGSGMHNAIFCKAESNIVSLNIMNNVQSRIANSFKQNIGYILGTDGAPRVFKLGWETPESYNINIDEFKKRVGPLLT